MADTTLTLDGQPVKRTLSTTTLARIVIPSGARYLQVGSSASFYEEVDTTQAVVDGAAVTADEQMLWQAGTYVVTLLDNAQRTSGDWYMYFAGSTADQALHLRALSGRSQ